MFKLNNELKLFFVEHKKPKVFDWVIDKNWIAYMVDIFKQLNTFNIQMKGMHSSNRSFLKILLRTNYNIGNKKLNSFKIFEKHF